MRFTSTIVAAALSLAAGCQAWTTDPNGVWTANNEFYSIRGGKRPSPQLEKCV